MPVKKETKTVVKKTVIASEAKQSKDSKKIATSLKAPRNDAAGLLLRNDNKTVLKKGSLSVPLYSLVTGKESGKLELPKEFFGARVNKALLSQALRVYMNNQKSHWSSTKTRGEVEGSTRKIYKQKGTGKARHGGIRAPIFVGGGIALGPKSRKVTLDLPKKMRQVSLISALSSKAASGEVMGVSGIEKATGRTKEFANLLKKINSKSALIVVEKLGDNMQRAVANLKNIDINSVRNINTLEVIRHKNLIFTKEALINLGSIEKTIGGNNG